MQEYATKTRPHPNPLPKGEGTRRAVRIDAMAGQIYAFVLAMLFATSARAADKVTFEDHLLPILRNECASCHNPDKKKGGLDLSTYQSALTGGDSGPIASANDPDASLLYKVVAQIEDPKMPKGKAKLPDKDINIFKQWIAGGLLENAGGKAVASNKPKMNLAVATISSARPAGPIAMPRDLSLEPVVYTKRPGALMCLAASPWAPLVAVGGRHQVLLYNTSTLDLLGILPFPDGDPYVTRFSRNGTTLLVGGGVSAKSGRAVLFDVATGNRITQVGDEFDAVIAADISPDQSTVALGGPGKTLKIYSTSDGQLLHALKKHTDWLTAVAYSPDGVLLASGDRQGGLWVWESQSANEFYSLTGHKAAITSLSFRDDSNILASASEDGSVKLWDMPTGKLVKTWNAHPSGVTSISFTHDGRLVTCGRDKVARLWKPDGSALGATTAFPDIALHATFDGEGKRIVAGDWSGSVRVFDAQTAKPVGDITANPPAMGERIATANQNLAAAQAAFDKDAAAFNLASKRLAEAKLLKLKLDTAQARSDLASKQAALEKISLAAKAARAAADRASTELKAAQQHATDEPKMIRGLEDALVAENDKLKLAELRRSEARHLYYRILVFARDFGLAAQHLSDEARGSRYDQALVDEAASAKARFDGINMAMDDADRATIVHSNEVDLAMKSISRAGKTLEVERAAALALPQLIETKTKEVDSTSAELRKLAQTEQQNAAAVKLAKSRLDSLKSEMTLQGTSPPTTQPVAQKR